MVGPRAEPDAGEPASPAMAETATIIAMAVGLNPNVNPRGAYMAATMGTAQNDDSMPRNIKTPMNNILKDAKTLLFSV
jgi:hypothetical protein